MQINVKYNHEQVVILLFRRFRILVETSSRLEIFNTKCTCVRKNKIEQIN